MSMTNDFSKGSKGEAKSAEAEAIGLMSGEQLITPSVENEIGAWRSPFRR
jgi:hypothetical protein